MKSQSPSVGSHLSSQDGFRHRNRSMAILGRRRTPFQTVQQPLSSSSKLSTSLNADKSNDVDNICVLCLEPMTGGSRNFGVAIPCGHCFHEDCFSGWLASKLLQDEHHQKGIKNDLYTVKCAHCSRPVVHFGKIFLRLHGASEEPEELAMKLNDDNGNIDLETIVRYGLWSHKAGVVETSLRKASAIMTCQVTNCLAFVHLGGHVVLLRAMERHSQNSAIQYESMRICQILASFDKLRSVLLATKGSVEVIATAMSNFPDDSTVQLCAIRAFRLICQQASPNTRIKDNEVDWSERLVKNQIIPMVLDSVTKSWPEREPALEVPTCACEFLTQILTHPQLVDTMHKEDAIPTLVSILNKDIHSLDGRRRGPNDQLLLLWQKELVCRTLARWAEMSEANKHAIRWAGGVWALVSIWEQQHAIFSYSFQDPKLWERLRDACGHALHVITGDISFSHVSRRLF